MYFFPVNVTSNKKHVIRRGMKKPHKLRVRFYAAHPTDINEHLDTFPGLKTSDKICDMEFNEILLNSIPNVWSKPAYVQDFDCETITLKNF